MTLMKIALPMMLLFVNASHANTPTILSSNLTLDQNGIISVKPEMQAQFNVNNQTGIAEGNRNSMWYSKYRLEVKKNNGKIEKIIEMFPRMTATAPALGKGSIMRDFMITNQNYTNGQLSEVLSCSKLETRSTFLLDAIESPIKDNSYDCYMASKQICEKMRQSLRHLNNKKGPKSFKDLNEKVNDCRENILANSIIALQSIDEAISDSPIFPKMLEESKKELIKKYGDSGYSMGKPQVNTAHGKAAFESLLGETGTALTTLSYYSEICDKFLPGKEGDLTPTDSPSVAPAAAAKR